MKSELIKCLKSHSVRHLKRYESIQKEDSVKRLESAVERYYPTAAKSPAQQEPNSTIGSASPAATMNIHGVTPYLAWDPAEENTCSINSS